MPFVDYIAFQGILGEREDREIGLIEESGWEVRPFLIHPEHGWVVSKGRGTHIIIPENISPQPIANELFFNPLFILLQYLRYFVRGPRAQFLYVQNFPDSYSIPFLFLAKALRIPTAYEIGDPWKEFISTETSETARSRARFALYYTVLTIFERLAIRLASGLIFATESLRELHSAENSNKPEFTLTNYSMYHDDAKTKAAGRKLRIQLGLDSSFVVSYIGGFQEYRGVDVLLQSMVKVVRRNRSVKLLLVGAHGAIFERTSQRIRELGIEESCVQVKAVPSRELPGYFAASDVGIIPYRRNPATELCAPNKLFNYLVLGKPLIVSNLMELSRHVKQGVDGLIVRPDDPEDLAKGILQLAADEQLRARMERNILSVSGRYSYDNLKAGFLQLICQVAEVY